MASSALWLLFILIIPVTAIAGYLYLRLTGTHLTTRRARRSSPEEVEIRHNIEIVTTSPEYGAVPPLEQDRRSGYDDELSGYRHPSRSKTFGDNSDNTGHLQPYGNTSSEDSGEGLASPGNSWRAGIAPKPNPRPDIVLPSA